MTHLTRACTRIEEAGNLPALLEAAYRAFTAVIPVTRAHARNIGDYFTAFVFAGGEAADGRDAIAAAPSLPVGWLIAPEDTAPRSDLEPENQTAGELATVAGLLATRLSQAATLAAHPADRLACRRGACCAREIEALFAGAGP